MANARYDRNMEHSAQIPANGMVPTAANTHKLFFIVCATLRSGSFAFGFAGTSFPTKGEEEDDDVVVVLLCVGDGVDVVAFTSNCGSITFLYHFLHCDERSNQIEKKKRSKVPLGALQCRLVGNFNF